MTYSSISSFEKSVVRTAMYSDLCQSKFAQSSTLFYTLIDLLRHKARCRCSACGPRYEQAMELVKTIPCRTGPIGIPGDKYEWHETIDPLAELWNVCKDVFSILEACHVIPRDDQNFFSTDDISKLDSFFTASKSDDGKIEYTTATTANNNWHDNTDDDDNDEEQSQD